MLKDPDGLFVKVEKNTLKYVKTEKCIRVCIYFYVVLFSLINESPVNLLIA